MANTNEAFPEPSKADIIETKKEGIKEAIKESTKDAYKTGADEGYGESGGQAPVFQGAKDVFQLQYLVDLAPEELTKKLNGGIPLSEGQIAGLLEVERSGKNRTDTVKVLCKRLGIKSPYEVTAAGPNYTNDTTQTTKL